ncbi:MAG TPA: transposase [Flavisolibacter sp.]|nr:transposase [Flavisolibacter sp.]
MERFIKKHGKQLVWSPTFKMHVARTVLEKGLSYSEAAELFNIKRYTSIGQWVKEFRKELAASNAIDMVNQSSPTGAVDLSCSDHISKLQSSLNDALLANTALNVLIDLAESTYGISIRKNSGTKQS